MACDVVKLSIIQLIQPRDGIEGKQKEVGQLREHVSGKHSHGKNYHYDLGDKT